MDAVHEETYKGLKLEVYQDEIPDSPRDWDNLGKMICFHNRYDLGDKHDFTVESIKELVENNHVISLRLYLYDHSGIGMSTSNNCYPYNCPWDAGQVGFIYVTESDVLSEYGGGAKRVSVKLREKILDILQNEVATYNQFLEGDVYVYHVIRPKNCKECGSNIDEGLDSCGGFYGLNTAIKDGKEAIDFEVAK